MANGRVAFEYTGLWYDETVGWWYVENGVIDFGYIGEVEYNGASWDVMNGAVMF